MEWSSALRFVRKTLIVRPTAFCIVSVIGLYGEADISDDAARVELKDEVKFAVI